MHSSFRLYRRQGACHQTLPVAAEEPQKFYREMFDSYNVPDFTKVKVDFDAREAIRQVFGNERVKVKIK